MRDLTPETRRLLEMARSGNRLQPRRRVLLKTKFLLRIASGAVLGLATPQVWAKAPGLFGPIAKGLAGVAIVSSLGVGGYLGLRASQHDIASNGTAPTTERSPAAGPPIVWLVPGVQTIAARPSGSQRITDAPAEAAAGSSTMDLHEGSAHRPSPIARPAPPSLARSPHSTAEVARSTKSAGPPPTQASSAAAGSPRTASESPPIRSEETPAARPSTLTDETRLLVEADQALRAGNAARAVAILDVHASTYPESSLAPERSGERILALCALGHLDAATVRGYLVARPTSLSARIREGCSGILSKSR